jgi:prophage antirepressor-like protein
MNNKERKITETVGLISSPDFGEIQTLSIKGEPWFLAKDVCEVLSYEGAPEVILRKLDEDEKLMRKIYASGQTRHTWFVNESGLYNLIFRSSKPEAKQFRKWVTSEVLPAIRKFGFYIHPSARLNAVQTRRLNKLMRESISRYLTAEDKAKVAKRMGVGAYYLNSVLSGSSEDEKIMLELQNRALVNFEKWEDPYSPVRMQDVINKLKK